MNNIYIGNRYVPIFANPVEWNNLREYEPLTIVTYQGTSYTSRQRVPVGIELSNREYWVVTGNYNHQVEEYRQLVEEYSKEVEEYLSKTNKNTEDINTLKTETTQIKKVTDNAGLLPLNGQTIGFIGDSWGAGNGVTPETAYPQLVCDKLGMKCVNKCVGGSGFIRQAGGNGKTYTDQLNDLVTENNTNKIDYVCVMGGFNDVNHGHDPEDIREACNRLISAIVENLPDAKIIWMGFDMRCNQLTETFKKAMSYVNNAYKLCNKSVIYGARNWQYDLIGFENYYSNDLVHPNTSGHIIIANEIVNTLLGVGNDMCVTLSANDNFSPFSQATASGGWCVRRENGTVIINIGSLKLTEEITGVLTKSTYTIDSHYAPLTPQCVPIYMPIEYDVMLMIDPSGALYLQKRSSGNIPAETTLHVPTITYQLYSKGKV